MFKVTIPSENVVKKGPICKYQLNDLKNVRKHLIQSFFKEKSKNTIEMESKLKAGILSDDVVDFYLNNKTPPGFTNIDTKNFMSNDKNQNNKTDYTKIEEKEIELNSDSYEFNFNKNSNENSKNDDFDEDDDDWGLSKKPKTNEFNSKLPNSTTSSSINSASSGYSSITPSSSFSSISSTYSHSNFLNQSRFEQKLDHECEVFCPRNCSVLNSDKTEINSNDIIYLCDDCSVSYKSRDSALKHLIEKMHISSSEYVVDSKHVDKTGFKIEYLKSRAVIKNTNLNSVQRCVFCPKCNFYSGQSTLACSIHSKYFHKDSQYSVANLLRFQDLEVTKSHVCGECKAKVKKLSDLNAHLKDSKHFPHPKADEINLMICPFEKCGFKATEYNAFKVHVVNHPYFNKHVNETEERKVLVKVYIYSAPKGYRHVTEFKGESNEDRLNELKGIDEFLELVKGAVSNVPDAEKIKAIRLRKEQLVKSINSDRNGINNLK
jgi:hypothetical protein